VRAPREAELAEEGPGIGELLDARVEAVPVGDVDVTVRIDGDADVKAELPVPLPPVPHWLR